MKIGRRREKAALPVLVGARPQSEKANGQLLEGSGPESAWPSVGARQRRPLVGFTLISGSSKNCLRAPVFETGIRRCLEERRQVR